MNRTISAILLLLTASALSAVSPEQIIEEADAIFTLNRIYQRSTMTIYSSGIQQPVQSMESYYYEYDGTTHSLTIFLEPKRVAGTAYLSIGNDLWVRFASTGRIRKMSSSAKTSSAGGSDFSYADMGEGNSGFGTDYSAELIGSSLVDGRTCHTIVLTPDTSDNDPYDKVIAYITQDENLYTRLELFSNGTHIKTMILDDYRMTGEQPYPYRITMRSELKDSKTVIETSYIEYDSPKVTKHLFRTSYLKSIKR